MESEWLHFGPEDQTANRRRELAQDFKNLTEWLLYGLIDFDYLSEALLPEQCREKMQPEHALLVGCMIYDAVVLSGMKTIRSTTLDLLEDFSGRGGKVIFMGIVPDLVDGLESGRAKALMEKSIHIQKDRCERLSFPERYMMRIKGQYFVTLYDTMTGGMEDMPVSFENGWTLLELQMLRE